MFGRILKARDHQEFAKKVTSIRGRMEVLQKQLDTVAEELKEAEDEMVGKGMDPLVSG